MSKQDRQGVRTARDLEQKYGFGQSFSEVKESLKVATKTAEQAEKQALKAHSEVLQLSDSIKLEVNNGKTTAQIKLKVGDKEFPATIDMKGLVTFSNLADADGTTVINGSNITTGQILADLIKAGTIKSKDGKSLVLNLDEGTGKFTGTFTTIKNVTSESGVENLLYTRIEPEFVEVLKENNETNVHELAYIAHDQVSLVKSGAQAHVEPNRLDIAAQGHTFGWNRIHAEANNYSTVFEMSRVNNVGNDETFRIDLGDQNEVVSPVDIKAPNFKGRADSVLGQYDTWTNAADYGGKQPPSYIGANNVKFNMMNGFKGASNEYFPFMDVLMMNAYSWSDIPYATAFGIQKTHGVPRAWIAAGQNGDSWGGVTELITANNINDYTANRALVGSPNNLLHAGNEFTYASNGFSGEIWHNYRTAGGSKGNITGYIFGNGDTGYSNVTLYAGNFTGKLGGQYFEMGAVYIPAYSTSGSNGYNYYGDVSVSHSFSKPFSDYPNLVLQVGTGTTGVVALEPISWSKSGIQTIRVHRASSANGVAGFYAYYVAAGG